MRMDKLTLKAQDAINTAQNIATDMNHYEIQPEHLLLALDRPGGRHIRLDRPEDRRVACMI